LVRCLHVFHSISAVLVGQHVGAHVSLSRPAHLRVLHSFPTRRSSDLGRFRPLVELSLEDWDATMGVNVRSLYLVTRAFTPIVARSEEHTSELQSRFDLVCRLLLEKKNHQHLQPRDLRTVDLSLHRSND